MLFDKNGHGIEEPEVELGTEESCYMMEAVMADELSRDELSMFLENSSEVNAALSEGILMERSIVRLDKKAKLNKAVKMAIFVVAKEKNDPNFKKLLTVWKMERYLEALLEKKYGNEARRRAKKMVNRRQDKKTVSSMVQKATDNANKMLNSKPTTVPPKPKEVRGVNVPKNFK